MLLAILAFFFVQNTLPTAQELAVKISSQGAKTTVRDLWGDQANWTEFLKHVSAGEANWLKIAVRLRSASDAGQLETLKIAVSMAIQHRPENFLAIAYPTFGHEVCRDIQIEPTVSQHTEFISNSRHALNHVNDPALTANRNECLESLK